MVRHIRQPVQQMPLALVRIAPRASTAKVSRIQTARTAQRFPLVLDRLADGSLTLTSIHLLSPHLTEENHTHALAAATHLKKRELEELILTGAKARCRHGNSQTAAGGETIVRERDADSFWNEFPQSRVLSCELRSNRLGADFWTTCDGGEDPTTFD